MTAAQRERLRKLVDRAKRRQIARARGRLEEQWTDDPGYIGRRRKR